MRKNGFTLVELLAVIVILAIIALIAVPIVLNIIEDTKNSATLRSADFYLDAVELSIAQAILDGGSIDGNYTVESNGNICKSEDSCITVEVSGDTPDSGSTITITDGEISSVSLNYDNKTVIKDNNELVFDDSEVNTVPAPVSFEADDWSTIIANIKAGNTDAYIVGAEKEITLTSTDDDSGNADGFTTGTYTVRLANKTTNDSEGVCANSTYSQTACGFVIEFVDIITTHNMNSSSTSVGGWPASKLREFVTPVEGVEGSGTIYNALPEEVRTAIIDTRVVSGYESGKSANYTSTDKLYLLSTAEVWKQGTSNTIDYDTARDLTRQLDYYEDYENTDGSIGVTTSKYSGAKKHLDGSGVYWWLRSAYSSYAYNFYNVNINGDWNGNSASSPYGVAAAFRLG